MIQFDIDKLTGKRQSWEHFYPMKSVRITTKAMFGYHEAYSDDKRMLHNHKNDKPEFYLNIGNIEGILGIAINSKRMAFFYYRKGNKLMRCTPQLKAKIEFIKSYQSRIEDSYCSDKGNLFLLSELLEGKEQ